MATGPWQSRNPKYKNIFSLLKVAMLIRSARSLSRGVGKIESLPLCWEEQLFIVQSRTQPCTPSHGNQPLPVAAVFALVGGTDYW